MKEQAIKAKGEADVAQLLKPRVKLIADWPGCQWSVGTIFPENFADFKKWPHLFRELPWYEEREASELPEYVWYNATGFEKKEILKVLKVTQWHVDEMEDEETDVWAEVEGDSIGFSAVYMPKPATETDYQNYLKGKL